MTLAVNASYGKSGQIEDESLKENINKIEGLEKEINEIVYDVKIVVDGYEFTISQSGNITSESKSEGEIAIREEVYEALKSSRAIIYKDLYIILDKETNDFKYYYNNNEIMPVYWYGFKGDNIYSDDNVTSWYETNCRTTITKNENSFTFSKYVTNPNSQCKGGLTSGKRYELGEYSKCHVIVNELTNPVSMQYVSVTGALGGNTVNENRNIYSRIEKSQEGPEEFIGDISGVNGLYYVGIHTMENENSIEVSAWWLEKDEEEDKVLYISGNEYKKLKEKSSKAINYSNLNIVLNEGTSEIEYYYQNKKIMPIYWYGIGGDNVTPWYESNYRPTITKNPNSFTYSVYTTANSYCWGGLTSSKLYNLEGYSKCHMTVKNSDVNTKMQYVSMTGGVGTNLSNENRNIILDMPKVTEGPVEYVGDISNASGNYYMGVQNSSGKAEIEISNWWLEI